MKFVFPICKADGSEYKSQSEIESILKQEHVGQFGYNPSNFSWHGGVHFTAKNVPWAKDNYPVRAIADGKIIACRLSSKYQETMYKDFNKELTLPFSHDFCLIEHEFLSKDETGTETKFVFYSLYMHLDPINFHQSLSPTKLYKFINGGWYGREFPGVNGPKTLLSANTILKRITSEPEVQIETNIFKLYEVVDNAGNKDALAKVGKRLWVAAPDDHFEMVDEKFPQAPKPNWMYKSTSESSWESIELDFLHNLGANSTLQVKAGDSIGYLGRFDVLNPKSHTSIDSRFQIHFEVFSTEKPPKEFLEAITNKDDLTKISYISDLNSDGFCDPENPREFFVALANSTQSAATSEQEITTPEEIVKHLSQWDANKFTIVQHESEWHDKAESKSIFDTLLQMFKERDLELPFKLEHEKQRVNQLIWMQDVGIGKHVWSWWPIYSDIVKKTWADTRFAQLLGKVESNNDYSAYNRTKGGLKAFFNTNLASLTIKEVKNLQKKREMFAVGRFQIIPATLSDAVKKLKIDENVLFDKATQDNIFNEYIIKIKRPNIIAYLESNGTVEEAIYDWAKEFASAGVQSGRKISKNRIAQGGESYYSGDGLNKAHLTPKAMIKALKESKNEI